MTKGRTKPSDQDLVSISEKPLLYEIKMLFATAQEIQTSSPGDIHNALIESFAIHARSLVSFLYWQNEGGGELSKCKGGKRPYRDDVFAEVFFDEVKTWSEQRPTKSGLLKTIHKRVGKEIAHLTFLRLDLTDDGKQWDCVNIAKDIAIVLREFLSVVPHHRVSSSFQQAVSSILQEQNSVGTRSTACTSL